MFGFYDLSSGVAWSYGSFHFNFRGIGFNFQDGYSAICSFLNSMQKCLLFPNTYEKYFPLVIEILTNIIISHRAFICIFLHKILTKLTLWKNMIFSILL